MKNANRTGRALLLPILILAGGVLFSPGFAVAQTGPGPEVCAACHDQPYQTYLSHRHSMKADARTPAAKGGCVVCHGDGTKHVNAGGGRGVGGIKNPGSKTMSAKERNALCLTCHQGDPNRLQWQASIHASRGDLACTSCHQIHAYPDKVRDKLTQPAVCFTCHKEQRVQVNKPSHHPILEGKVSCSDCHNVHGNNPKQLIKDSVNETCYQCHMEKRGPFVFSHQPVTENCAICHQPHGTTIYPMLKSRPPFLCQDCHASTGHPSQNAGVPRQRTTGSQFGVIGTTIRGCLNCHTNIHGTNSLEGGEGRRFLR